MALRKRHQHGETELYTESLTTIGQKPEIGGKVI
jgi:hypothetical protein